jgi:hypothetical protein
MYSYLCNLFFFGQCKWAIQSRPRTWDQKSMEHKQSARWQHLSQLKASAFLFEFFSSGVKKHNNFYLRLVMSSSG